MILIMKMKKLSRALLFGAFLLTSSLLTSCFDFVERIDMHDSGAGRIEATLNLSKSKTKVASLMKLKEVSGFKVPSEADIRKEMAEVVSTLRSTKGISEVDYKLDFKNYIATLSCKFASVDALNQFSATLSQQFKVKLNSYNSYAYDRSAGAFKRSYTYAPGMGKQFAKVSGEDQKLFDDAYYATITRFDKPIQAQSHKAAKLSDDKKASLLRIKAVDHFKGSATLSNTINLSK